MRNKLFNFVNKLWYIGHQCSVVLNYAMNEKDICQCSVVLKSMGNVVLD